MPFVGEDEEIGFVGPDEDIPWEGPTQANPALPESVNFPSGPGEEKYITGRNPRPLSPIPNLIRLGVPLGASAVLAPETLLGRAIVGGLGGAAGEYVAQGGEIAQGARQSVDPRELLGAGIRNSVPVVSPESLLARVGGNAALQGAGATLADVVATGGVQPMSTAIATGLGGGIPLVQPILTRGTRGLLGATQALRAGEDIGPALRRAGAEVIRPVALSARQQASMATRGEIESMTGAGGRQPVKVPVSISDVVDMPELTPRSRIPGTELTDQDMKAIADRAIHFAAQTQRGTDDASDIAKKVWESLGERRDAFNAATQRAVEDYSNRASKVVSDTKAESERLFSQLYPGGRSRKAIGDAIESAVDVARKSSKQVWDAAYDAARTIPAPGGGYLYDQVTIPAAAINDKARALGLGFAKNEDGSISVISAPREASGAIGAASSVKGNSFNPDLLSLDQARSLHTQLNNMLRKGGRIQGVEGFVIADLLDTVHSEIEHSVSAFPALKDALAEANDIYKNNISRFKNSFSRGILNDVGVNGGLLPETVVDRLTSDKAESYLENLEEMTGQQSSSGKIVGVDLSNDARNLVREAFLSEAAAKGSKLGEIDLGKAFDQIADVPEPVRKKLFPNFVAMQDAAKKSKDVKAVLDALENHKNLLKVDPVQLRNALGSSNAEDLTALAKQAAQKSAQQDAAMKAMSLDELADRDSFDIYEFLSKPRNTPYPVARAMQAIEAKNPQLASDVRALYVDDLLESAGSDPEKVIAALGLPSSSSATKQGSLAGVSLQNAEAILGKNTVSDMRRISALLKSIPKSHNIPEGEARKWWEFLAIGNPGAFIGSRTGPESILARALAMRPALRYRFAAAILTDDSLRRQAMQATGPQFRDVVNRGLSILNQNLARQYGWNSRQVSEIEDLRSKVAEQK